MSGCIQVRGADKVLPQLRAKLLPPCAKRGLTLRSRRGPTAGHQTRAGGTRAFSPARAWRPAVGPASPQTLGFTNARSYTHRHSFPSSLWRKSGQVWCKRSSRFADKFLGLRSLDCCAYPGLHPLEEEVNNSGRTKDSCIALVRLIPYRAHRSLTVYVR